RAVHHPGAQARRREGGQGTGPRLHAIGSSLSGTAMADGRITFLPRGPMGVWRALRWSLKGLVIAWQTESSFRLEVWLFVPLCPLALWLGQSGVEKTLLVGSMLMVLSAELLNSAVEAVIE